MPELLELSYSAQMQKLTAVYCQSVSWVIYHHSLLKLHPKIQERLDPSIPKKQRMKISMAVYLATIDDQDAQLRIFEQADKKGFSIKQSRNYTRVLAAKEGHKIGLHRRTPVSDFRPFLTFFRGVAEDLEIYETMPQRDFEAMFKFRSPDEVGNIMKGAKSRSARFAKLAERIAATLKQR